MVQDTNPFKIPICFIEDTWNPSIDKVYNSIANLNKEIFVMESK